MKFEDKINSIIKTLNEDIGTMAPQTVGNPQAVNPAQVAPQGQQLGAQQGGEITADQLMQFALNSDPKQLQTMGIDANLKGDELFQAVHAAFSQTQGEGNGANGNAPVASPSNTANVPGL